MKERDFLTERRKVWAKWERHYGMQFSEPFRKAIEERSGPGLALYPSLEGLKDLDASIPEFVEPALILLNNRNGTSDSKKVEPDKRRRKHFERRFYLVRFITDCWERDRRSYIPWQYVTTEWNKAHPSDQISKSVLKAEYYRALFKERDIVIQLLAVKKWNNNDTFQRFLERLRKHYNVDPNTLKTFNETWLHLVMKKDDRPLRKFLKQMKWQTTKDIAELKAELKIEQREAQNEDSNTTKRTDLHRGGEGG